MSEEASAPARKISFSDTAGRSEVVRLDHPLVVDGVVLDAITVHRLTVGEVSEYVRRVQEATPEQREHMRVPIFDQPDDVIDALDDDDAEKLGEVALRFLPRRFRAADVPD